MTSAKPEIKKGKKLTAIWIIPLVAMVLGAWMVVHNIMTQGPEITVSFNTAKGLVAGKTVVKYRNVDMGLVKDVVLSDDLQTVTAIIKMDLKAEPLLDDDSRFWVVSAQIGGGTISGLDTILSGAYIAVVPGSSGVMGTHFIGLEEPPVTPADAPGVRVTLISERASSVNHGDPVLYKGFTVGRVETQFFDPDTKEARYTIFIDAPYDELVTTTVRFWDISGISLSAGADGIKIRTGSINTILQGGITFAIPPDFGPGVRVEDNAEFRLFPTFDDILASPYEYRAYYVVRFNQSIKGLLPGAPVEYRGIKIGEVRNVMVKELVEHSVLLDVEPQGVPIPVLIYIEPGRYELQDSQDSVELVREAIAQGVDNGLRATLEQGNLLTGAQLVQMDYFPDAPPEKMGEFDGKPTIPTIVTGLSGLEAQISSILKKVDDLPLEQTVSSMNLALKELNQSMKALRAILEDEDTRSIPDDLRKTLGSVTYHLDGESTSAYQLERTLKEVESASRALREFLDLLETKPEALIRGKQDTER